MPAEVTRVSALHRVERRLRHFRGKRNFVVDPGRRSLEDAVRARVARKVRSRLRRLEPVLLITPRWSQVHRFLDDLAIDLGIGEPDVRARVLALSPIAGRTVEESWNWLVHALTEFLELPLEGPIAQAVNRHGFRHVVGGLLRRSTRGERRVLLIHGCEHLNVEARSDLVKAFEDHADEVGADRMVGLLIAGSVDGPNFEMRGCDRVVLPDYGEREAIDILAEYVGPADRERLEAIVQVVGGVPALLDRLGSEAELTGRFSSDREGLWRALGNLAEEVRGAVSIVSAVEGLAERLEDVSREGALPEDTRWDRMLVRAGLLAVDGGLQRRVRLRAPLFAEIAAGR